METEAHNPSRASNLSPWWEIWIRPRKTIRQFLDSLEPEKNIILISMIAGFVNALNQASSKNAGDDMSLTAIFFTAFIAGSISGILGLYILSFILTATGRWLGGTGDRSNLRVALARGFNVPTIMIGLLWIPELLLFGIEMFTEETPRIDSSGVLLAVFFLFMLVELVLVIWSIVIGLKAIGEAHQFTALKAFWSTLIPLAIILVIVLIIHLLFSLR